jgi:hypothetical protein
MDEKFDAVNNRLDINNKWVIGLAVSAVAGVIVGCGAIIVGIIAILRH